MSTWSLMGPNTRCKYININININITLHKLKKTAYRLPKSTSFFQTNFHCLPLDGKFAFLTVVVSTIFKQVFSMIYISPAF